MSARAGRVGTDLTEGHITKTLLRFALPLLLTNLIQQLYNTVDLIIVGHFAGTNGTVGVGTGGEIVNLLTMFGIGFSSAAQVYISQLYGAHDMKKIRKTIGTTLTVMTIMSVVFMAISMIFCDPLLRLLNTHEDAFSQARSYMLITALGLPFIYGYNAICNVLRGMGESKRPMIFVTIAAASNIVLDLFFVAVLKMASAGTAIATVMAQVVSFVASLVFMYRKREQFDFDFKPASFKVSGEQLKILVRLGLPRAAQSTMISLSLLYCTSMINSFGKSETAINIVGNKLARFSNIVTLSIDQAAASMVGQCLGARKVDRARKVVYTSLAFAMTMAAINCALALFIPRTLIGIFNSDEAVLALAPRFMRIQMIAFVLSGIMGPFQSVITGSGNAMLGFITGLLDGVVLRIGLSLLFAYVFHMEVWGYFLGNALARLAPTIINTWYFYSNRWAKRKLLTEG